MLASTTSVTASGTSRGFSSGGSGRRGERVDGRFERPELV